MAECYCLVPRYSDNGIFAVAGVAEVVEHGRLVETICVFAHPAHGVGIDIDDFAAQQVATVAQGFDDDRVDDGVATHKGAVDAHFGVGVVRTGIRVKFVAGQCCLVVIDPLVVVVQNVRVELSADGLFCAVEVHLFNGVVFCFDHFVVFFPLYAPRNFCFPI